jgi:NADH-quinone oxidoreductase subunit G
MMQEGMNGLILLGVEPEYDCANPSVALNTLKETDFVISMSSFVTNTMKDYADVLLPVSPYTETSGTFVNVVGDWQSFNGSVEPMGDTRPAWKVLRVLGNLFDVDGFDYVTSEEVRDELKNLCSDVPTDSSSQWRCPASLAADSGVNRIGYLPLYSVDALVRRSQPLQETSDAIKTAVYVNSKTANQLDLNDSTHANVSQGFYSAMLKVVIDEAVADNCVMIPMAVEGSHELGDGYGAIEVRPA